MGVPINPDEHEEPEHKDGECEDDSWSKSPVALDIDRGGDLLSYAAMSGKHIDGIDVQTLSRAQALWRQHKWDRQIEGEFYTALSRISRSVAPAVAATVGTKARQSARVAIQIYTYLALAFSVGIVVLSCVFFIAIQISDDIASMIRTSDAAVLGLHNRLQVIRALNAAAKEAGKPELLSSLEGTLDPPVVEEMDRVASYNRQLYGDVRRIGWMARVLDPAGIQNPYGTACGAHGPESALDSDASKSNWPCDPATRRAALEITLPLTGDAANPTSGERASVERDVVEQGFQKIAIYQDVRAMASLAHDNTLALGLTVMGFVLPVLCACLGACAAILRRSQTKLAASTFHPEFSRVSSRVHLASAAVVGILVGLLSGQIYYSAVAFPFVMAFILGYVCDGIFHTLDSIARSLTGLHGEPGQRPSRIPVPPDRNND